MISRLIAAMLLAGLMQTADARGTGKGLSTDRTISVAGVERQFHLFVPDDPVNAPVVLLFHGHNSTGDELLGLDGGAAPFALWLELAEQENILVAVPEGLFTSSDDKGWNDCRADAPTNSSADDVGFISRLIDEVVAEHRADPARVYVTGISNGGHFSIRLAEEIPGKLAAFAAIAAADALNSECPEAAVPVSALFMNGTADPLLPFEGGTIAATRGEVFSAEDTVAAWVERNGTATLPEIVSLPDLDPDDGSHVDRVSHRGGRGGSEVELFRIVGGGHTAPSMEARLRLAAQGVLGNQNGDIEMVDEVWRFFADKRATQAIGNLGTLLFDADAPGDGFYIVSDERFVSVAFFGYGFGGELLWMVGTEAVADLAPRFGEAMGFTLYRGGPNGAFLAPQDPNIDGLEVWGDLTLTLDCTAGERPRLSGSAMLDGAEGMKTMQLSSNLSDPEACGVGAGPATPTQ